MKIMICGSMTFAREMLRVKQKLEKLRHEVKIPLDTDSHVKNPELIDDFESNYKHAQKTNIMRKCFEIIAESDAILVLNHTKNGIKEYVGTSSLMEMGVAYYLHKRIFLLNGIPRSQDARWAHEIRIMQPVILDGDFSKIK